MKFHKIAEIFPLLQETELKSLAADIKMNGLKQKIILYNREILDGRNRFRACELAGVEPEYETYEGDNALAYVISLNLHRRHLNESQRAMVAAKLANMEPGGDRQSQKHSADLRNAISQPEAAKMLNVSERLLQDAKAVIREAPEQVAAIESGDKTVSSVKQETRRKTLQENPPEMPEGIFNVIYADPPWQYSNSGFASSAVKQYETMPTPEICKLKFKMDKNAVLFLWATNPLLGDAFKVISAWGFEYKTNFVWVKKDSGATGGFYVLGRHELLLIAVKGQMLPFKTFDSVIESQKTKHSVKPEIVYEFIEAMYPNRAFLELFARQKRKGWTTFGTEKL